MFLILSAEVAGATFSPFNLFTARFLVVSNVISSSCFVVSFLPVSFAFCFTISFMPNLIPWFAAVAPAFAAPNENIPA